MPGLPENAVSLSAAVHYVDEKTNSLKSFLKPALLVHDCSVKFC